MSNTIFLTIWDGGGIDTYDFSAFSTPQFIDLAPGRNSNLGTQLATLGAGQTARGNVFNALQHGNNVNSLIENAIGGTGDDVIQGNIANNRLEGGDGADDLYGLNGQDTLIGGIGTDELIGGDGDDMLIGGAGGDILSGGDGFDTAAYTSALGEVVTITPVSGPSFGRWTVAGPAQAGGDLLSGIEGFVFGEGGDVITLASAPGYQIITIDGAGGNDIINGSHEYETLIGGLGTDSLRPNLGRFNAYGGAQGVVAGTWIESLAQNDELILNRRTYDGNFSFVDPTGNGIASQPSPHFFSCDSKAVGLDAKSPRHLQREAGPTDRVIPRVT